MDIDRKANILLVLETLKKHTDDNHPISQSKLTELVNKDFGVNLDRKTVRDHLSLLKYITELYPNELTPLIIGETSSGAYYVKTNQFEVYEVNFLIDAILASKSLNAADAVDLADKIIKTLPNATQKIYSHVKQVYKQKPINRTSSEETLATIEAIYKAIADQKQICFMYKTYNLKGELTSRNDSGYIYVNPYKVINKKGDYYLLASVAGSKSLTTYRVDYMEDTQEHDENRMDISEIPGCENFDIIKYLNEHIYFADGKIIDVKVHLNNSDGIRFVYDWFGKTAKVVNTEDGLVATMRGDENAIYYWCMQYVDNVQVLEPDSLVKRVLNASFNIQLNYFNRLSKTRQKKSTLSTLYRKVSLVAPLRFTHFSELRLNDVWSNINGLKNKEVQYMQTVQYIEQVGKNFKTLNIHAGREQLVYLLLIVHEILNYAKENNIEYLYEGNELFPIKYFEEKYYVDRLTINDKLFVELSINIIIKVSSIYPDLANLIESVKRQVSSYMDKYDAKERGLRDLFSKVTEGYGFIFNDAEISDEIIDIKEKLGIKEESLKVKAKNN